MTAADVKTGLDALFHPRAVAVVGASGKAGSMFARPLRYLTGYGFDGAVYPVNPGHDELEGRTCYPSLDALPEPVDLVCLLLPAARAVDAVRDAARAGARVVIVFASGFAEVGEQGRALQDELAAVATETGVRLLGPNCQGLLYRPNRLVATFTGALERSLTPSGDVAYVGQSGAIGGSVLHLARDRGLGLDAWVSVGNQADLDVVAVADHLVADPAIRVVALYLETVDGAGYRALAAHARAAGKHLVVLRAGRSTAGASAMQSHTGTLQGPGAGFELLSEREHVTLVGDVPELVETAFALSAHRLPAGPRVGIVTSSGGAGILAADHCEAHGLAVPALSESTRVALADLVPGFGATRNPVDVTAQLFSGNSQEPAGDDPFSAVCTTVAESGEVDVVAVILTMVVGETAERLARGLVHAGRTASTPILFAWLAGEELTQDARTVLREAGDPVYSSVESLARAAARLVRRGAGRAARPITAIAVPALPDVPAGAVTEARAAALLDAVGVPRPGSRLVHDGAGAAAAAAELGGAVVLKVQSPDLVHKTEAGGVALGVRAADAEREHDALLARVGRAAPHATVDGVLVAQQLAAGTELIVGITGGRRGLPPILTVGAGGVATELHRDVASTVLPVDAGIVRELLDRLQCAPLLRGHRGRPPLDIDAVVSACVGLAALAEHLGDRLVELECNPLLVRESGVVALDCVLQVSGSPAGDRQGCTSARADGGGATCTGRSAGWSRGVWFVAS